MLFHQKTSFIGEVQPGHDRNSQVYFTTEPKLGNKTKEFAKCKDERQCDTMKLPIHGPHDNQH